MEEIKSSLVNSKRFKWTKASLLNASQHDDKQNFRVKCVDYINMSCESNDDEFFYDMLEHVRFLLPNNDDVAYTDPIGLIYLNCPGIVGENIRKWDGVYCHECLHQLWDTFAVAEKIKNANIEYNHELLNIASDCVINDYLMNIKKKELFEEGVTPDWIKSKYGVVYDRKYDTQYSLYIKLLDNKKENPNSGQNGDQKQNGGQNGDQNQDNKQNGGQNGDQKQNDGQDGNQKQNGGQNGDQKKDGGQNGDQKQNGGQNGDKKQNGGQNGDQKHNGGQNGDQKQNGGQNGDQKQNKDNGDEQAKGYGKGSVSVVESPQDLEEIRQKIEKTLKNAQNKISGSFGELIEKMKSSVKMQKDGLKTNVLKGASGWNISMNRIIQAFVKNRVYQKQKQYTRTFSRIKRGSGFVEYGKPIMPGKKVIEDKLNITFAFYIDRSGSMGDDLQTVIDAAYKICESIKKIYKSNKFVDEIAFKLIAFDTEFKEIKYGSKVNLGGGTCSFDQIIDYITKNTNDYLINIIITDGQFSVDIPKSKELINSLDGLLIFITNSEQQELKNMSKDSKLSMTLKYIETPDFNID